ncbi:MAG: type II toxin-antitoxin system HicB family antitoxin [Bacilli bacterium]
MGSGSAGCVTEGDTVEEAIANAKEAIALYMDLLTEQGEDIPEDADAMITTVEV